ncbi:MAG: hypothetical protein QF898_07795 [SAR202 cluster bacterium]|jgi:hypothetical protein|nr:hypothetical protein [SAR202 cluster bacterium]MDP6512450.1 hypothetical protein [SAR202 cluster bacterium]
MPAGVVVAPLTTADSGFGWSVDSRFGTPVLAGSFGGKMIMILALSKSMDCQLAYQNGVQFA